MTTTPNSVVAAVPHDRMPVILTPEGAAKWLSAKHEVELVTLPAAGGAK